MIFGVVTTVSKKVISIMEIIIIAMNSMNVVAIINGQG